MIFLAGLWTSCNLPAGDPVYADLVLFNGSIWTLDDNQPRAEAVAITDGKFVAVGSDRNILALAGSETQTIDLQGAFVVPGFNDSHVHFGAAARFLEFNIMRITTQEDFETRIQAVIEWLPPGEWIVGGFWGAYDQWVEGSTGGEERTPFSPDIRRIDELTAEYPMFIRKFDDSEFAVNSAALELAGIDPEHPVAPGITFVKDENDTFTGLMRGSRGVERLFGNIIPDDFSYERRLAQSRNALAEIRKYGVTSVSDISDDSQLTIYRELYEAGELSVRVHFRYHLERWKELAEQDIHIGSGDEWIRLGSLKAHIDGIMGTSTARFFEPYDHDPGSRGNWRRLLVDDEGNFEEGKLLGYLLGADSAGFQITVHAIGDEANWLLLNYLEELNRQNGEKDRRFRLVHAQVLAEDDFERLGRLGVIAEVQPFHVSDDMRWMEERIGYERSKGTYAFRRIQDGGSALTFGTDWPGTSAAEYPINPMLGLYAAVTRQTVSGQPEEGWFPAQRISIEDAIKAYTYNSAYASFEEDIKGSIKTGKLADLAVLSQNLLEIPAQEILNTETLYTIVGGQIVYQKGATLLLQ